MENMKNYSKVTAMLFLQMQGPLIVTILNSLNFDKHNKRNNENHDKVLVYYLGLVELKMLKKTHIIGSNQGRNFIRMMQNIPWFGKPKGLLKLKTVLILSLNSKDFYWSLLRQAVISKTMLRASLVAQWLRIRLSMQGTRVRALVWEDPTCRGATGPVHHNY